MPRKLLLELLEANIDGTAILVTATILLLSAVVILLLSITIGIGIGIRVRVRVAIRAIRIGIGIRIRTVAILFAVLGVSTTRFAAKSREAGRYIGRLGGRVDTQTILVFGGG
jgi:hypothetical protein